MLRTEIENLIIKSCGVNTVTEAEEMAVKFYIEEIDDPHIKMFVPMLNEALGKDAGKKIFNECTQILHDYISKAIRKIFYSNNYGKQKMVVSVDMIDRSEPMFSIIKYGIIVGLLEEIKTIPVLGTYDANDGLLTPNEEGIKEYMKLYAEDHLGKL